MHQVYETVNEGSYIKMIDMVSGHGGQIQVSSMFYFIVSLNIILLRSSLSCWLVQEIAFESLLSI